MRTLDYVVPFVVVLFGSVVPASAQDQSVPVPETATVQSEQDQSVPATVQTEQDQSVPTVHVTVPSQGITVIDVATVVAATVAFLAFIAWIVNFIVSRSEGRINKEVKDAREANEKAHEGIVHRVDTVDEKIARMDAKIDRMDEKIDRIGEKIDKLKRSPDA